MAKVLPEGFYLFFMLASLSAARLDSSTSVCDLIELSNAKLSSVRFRSYRRKDSARVSTTILNCLAGPPNGRKRENRNDCRVRLMGERFHY